MLYVARNAEHVLETLKNYLSIFINE